MDPKQFKIKFLEYFFLSPEKTGKMNLRFTWGSKWQKQRRNFCEEQHSRRSDTVCYRDLFPSFDG